jgi:hypothetical protein
VTQPLTEISTRNVPGGNGRPASGADNPTADCEPMPGAVIFNIFVRAPPDIISLQLYTPKVVGV